MTDNQIFDLIKKEENRQKNGIELIASENYVSDNVMKAMGSVLTNKYAEGLPKKRYYGGCEVVDEIEIIAQERLQQLFGIEFSNVQPHSGAQANAAVMLSILKPGDKILGFDLSHGGHLTHGSPVNFSGLLYQTCFYGVSPETGIIDYDAMEETALREKPKLIIVGASSYSRDWDYARFRKVAGKIGALILADISHPAGLIATGLLNNPFDYCHIVSSTTHKTLRGPRGGVIMIGKDFDNPLGIKTPKGILKKMSDVINSGVFPGTQGGPLEHVIAAKAVAFGEANTQSYKDYIQQVKNNTALISQLLIKLDYNIISNGSDNHLLLIDLRNKGLNGKEIENALVKADITINKNMVPFDDKSPFITSGIRIGSPAITTRGITEEHIPTIVNFFDKAIQNFDNEIVLNDIKNEVNSFMSKFPLYK